MPYAIRKISSGKYEVINSMTGDVKAAGTSKRNAKRQVRLLHGVDHGWKPGHKFGGKRDG
jgi:hypothetical protein